VSQKNDTDVAHYNFNIRQPILVIFGRGFGQLILMKIIEIIATRCQILRLKCTKFDFGCGSDRNPAAGAYSAPPDLLAVFKGPSSREREEQGREGERRERDGRSSGSSDFPSDVGVLELSVLRSHSGTVLCRH